MSQPKIVKRYANRKLYDTERSCYVTLEDIAAMIKAGDEVRVVDNKSGEDLTTVTLAQIIFEAEKKSNFMPMNLLRDLVRNSGDAIGDFAREQAEKVQARANEFKETAEKLRKETKETAEKLRHDLKDRIDGVIHRKPGEKVDGAEAPVTPKVLGEMLESTQKAFAELQKGVEERVKEGVGAVSRYAHLDKEMDEISKRLAALEQRLEKMS
jgi:polyhydroxyalkanoate synthesis repressor PhaR